MGENPHLPLHEKMPKKTRLNAAWVDLMLVTQSQSFPSVRRGCLKPRIRCGVIFQSCVDVWDEDGEKPMEK